MQTNLSQWISPQEKQQDKFRDQNPKRPVPH